MNRINQLFNSNKKDLLSIYRCAPVSAAARYARQAQHDRTGRQGVFRLCAVPSPPRADISQKSLSPRYCGCPLSCI